MMRMKAITLGLFLMVGVPAFADTFVSMTLSGTSKNGDSVFASTNEWGGEPIGAYTGVVGGSNYQIACLDFALSTYVGESYTYDVTTEAPSDTTDIHLYQAAAILTQQLVNTTNLTTRGILSFAIWDIFEPTNISGDTNADVQANLATIQADANTAITQANANNGIPNFTVYYPDPNSTIPLGTPGSQRYIAINATPREHHSS